MKKVKPDGSKTFYTGMYEVDKTSGGTVTKIAVYYPVGGATLAPGASAGVRINGTLYFILKDHLSSSSVVTDASGTIIGEDRFYPYGETRFTTGSMNTDKLFTGQHEMTGLGIYHYGARFYSPKLGRFLSPDTIVPGYANPQAWNRYSYVLGNPLKYTDPTGHAQASDPYTESDGECDPGDTSCNWVETDNNSNNGNDDDADDPIPNGVDGDNACQTVTCRILNGDYYALIDLLFPTHGGWRLQGEGSLTLGPWVGPGVSGTLGANVAFNRKSEEFGLFFDWSLEMGAGVGPTLGASATTGPIVGWGSSTVKDVAVGGSYLLSGTASAEAAVSVALSVPRDRLKLHVDPVYGQVPVTAFGGAGAGSPYGGVGGGISHVFGSVIIDLSPYLP